MNLPPLHEMPSILVIDDEPAILQTLSSSLQDENFMVHTLQDGTKALETIGALLPDLILLDVCMPHCNGIELLTKIKQQFPTQNVIIISGYGTISIATQALKAGAIDFLEKPLNLDEILHKLSFLKKNSPLPPSAPLPANETNFSALGIVGQSLLFCELLKYLKRIAPTPFPVLISGPSGSGKTLFSKLIAHLSGHNQQAVTIIDGKRTSAITNDAFKKPGTIIIKHVELLSPHEQQALLEIMHNKKTLARIIATSPVNLFNLVQQRIFNASLFAALNSLPIELLALSKRRYDIPLLINHFVARANITYNKQVALSNQALRQLCDYQWPDDVRELEQCINALVADSLPPHHEITPAQCIEILTKKRLALLEEQSFSNFTSLEEACSNFEKKFLSYHAQKNQYNLSQLSATLKISLAQLNDKLKKFNMSPSV